MDDQRIRQLVQAAHAVGHTAEAEAQTFLKSLQGVSKGVLLACSDGRDYAVKGRQNGRALVNDRLVNLLGQLLGAPVGLPALIDLTPSFKGIEPRVAHIPPGISHGLLWVPNCSEREALLHTDEPENRSRFALLAVLYGWMHARDHQFIYENSPPHRVHSVDHGHFFNGGPNWTEATLLAAPAPQLDQQLVAACNFTDVEVAAAAASLQAFTDDQIVEALGKIPVDWGLSMQETVVLGLYLCERREQLSKLLRR